MIIVATAAVGALLVAGIVGAVVHNGTPSATPPAPTSPAAPTSTAAPTTAAPSTTAPARTPTSTTSPPTTASAPSTPTTTAPSGLAVGGGAVPQETQLSKTGGQPFAIPGAAVATGALLLRRRVRRRSGRH